MRDFAIYVLWVTVFILSIFGVCYLVSLANGDGIIITTRGWQCTAARVVKDTPPKVEECVQYSRKDAPHAP